MLLRRVLTAIPLAAVVIWLIFYQPTGIILYVLLIIAALACYEWAHLSGVEKIPFRALYSVAGVTVSWLFLYKLDRYAPMLIAAAVVWWFILSFYLFSIRPVKKDIVLSPVKLLTGMFLIPLAMLSISQIHSSDQGPWWLISGLLIVWIADISAYFSGRRFGKTKLAPHISPGKTIEGLYGAVIATVLFAVCAGIFFKLNIFNAIVFVCLAVIVTLISVSGDLYISVLKREAGVKDSGKILPGHGGVLDRIDSVLSAMPVFYTALYWLMQPLMDK